MKATPEHTFTKEELEKWIKSVGGRGAEVKIPEDAYHFSSDGNYLENCEIVGQVAKIVEIRRGNITGRSYVYFSPTNGFPKMALWLGMRNTKPVVLYPQKCKKCQFPSRNMGNYTFCSNNKCKTRKQINKIISKPPKIIEPLLGTKENPIENKCPKCNEPAFCRETSNRVRCVHGHIYAAVFDDNMWYRWSGGSSYKYIKSSNTFSTI